MWFRFAIKQAAVAAMLGGLLAGCNDLYLDRRDSISLASGDASASNRVTHTIDPWPEVSGNRNIAYNGERAAAAAARYRTGRVIQPINATTSSVGYNQTQQQQQSQSGAGVQGSSASAGASSK